MADTLSLPTARRAVATATTRRRLHAGLAAAVGTVAVSVAAPRWRAAV